MKKVISRILVVLNCILILLFLLLSGAMLLLSFTPAQGIGGYFPLLFSPANGTNTELMLLTQKEGSLKESAQILLRQDGEAQIITVGQIEENYIYYDDGDGSLSSVDLETSGYQGVIIFRNGFLGGILRVVAAPEHAALSYLCIGGAFILCAGGLFLAYFLSKRANASFLEDEQDLELLRSLIGEEPEDMDYLDVPPEEPEIEESFPEEDPAPAQTWRAPFPAPSSPRRTAEPELIYALPAHPEQQRQAQSYETGDVKIYTPHSAETLPPEPVKTSAPRRRSEGEVIIQTHTQASAYDLYDVMDTSIEDMLNDIEKQFKAGLDTDKKS